jgi:hypothetical protein
MEVIQSPKFLKGNQQWKLRSVHGRGKIFASAELLRAEAMLYFDWCDKHPRMRAELVKHQGTAEQYDVPIGRPYTMDGLCNYLGVSGAYFRAAKAHLDVKIGKKLATVEEEELRETIAWVEDTTRNDQIEGGMVGQYNANLVSRLNGLADNVNNTVSGPAVLSISVRDDATAANLSMLESSL